MSINGETLCPLKEAKANIKIKVKRGDNDHSLMYSNWSRGMREPALKPIRTKEQSNDLFATVMSKIGFAHGY
jgi:hypothetical protein